MSNTFRTLLAAMPDIARACQDITDPQLRDKAFDVLVAAAQNGEDVPSLPLAPAATGKWTAGGSYTTTNPDSTYSGFAPAPSLAPSYDPTSTRVDNGLRS